MSVRNHASEAQTATRIVQNNGIPRVQEMKTDICVVGAGIAGVSAAIEAARLGRRVTIIDGLPTLGGQAVNSIVGTFVGLFANGPDPEKHYQLTHGIADEILRDLGNQGALHYRRGPWTTVMYDEVALSRWIETTIYKEGIDVLLGAVLRGVKRVGRRIESIELSTRYGDYRLAATSFVDASGDAALTWQAGLPCREPEDGPIYGSQMVVIEGVRSSEAPPRTEIAKRLGEVGDDYQLHRKEGLAFVFPGRETALINMNHVETPMDPLQLFKKSMEGKEQADRTVEFLRNEFPAAYGDAHIRAYGQLGIRQTRWIVGRQHLTLDDVLNGTEFPDAVARTAWGIELHDRKDSHIFHTFGEGHVHYVPWGSLTPPDVDNLMAVGRCIDADVAALSSVRVMGPCIAMGAAAAHTLDLAGNGSVHDINMKQLQERIKDNTSRTD